MGTIEIVDMGDMDIGKVNTPMQCAEMCIGVSNFTCNSFDFCPQDPQRTCRLNQQHISDGLRTKNRSTCGHYSSKMFIINTLKLEMLPAFIFCYP